MILEDKIKYMIDNGFTYGQLARIVKCSNSTLSNWIRGDGNISERMKESIEAHIKSFIQNLNEIWK